MSLKLYWASGACSFVPHVLLQRLGVPFEPVMVKLHKGEHLQPPYLAINPRGQVPTLVDGAQVITQVLAIVSYLDALHPQASLLPAAAGARARAMERLCWMNSAAHITFGHIFLPHKFTDDVPSHAAMQAFNRQRYREALALLQSMVQEARQQGGLWLDGEQPGAQDAYALTLARWGSLAGIDPTDYQPLWAYVHQLAAQPGVAAVMERERLKLDCYTPQAA